MTQHVNVVAVTDGSSTKTFSRVCNNATVWVYVPCLQNSHKADKDFPVCQTYVDTVLEGCMADQPAVCRGVDFEHRWLV